jgi:thymidylate synthase ThyX
MRAQATLRNWLGFLELRDHVDAQWEIQQYAKAVASLVESLFPRTYELFRGVD